MKTESLNLKVYGMDCEECESAIKESLTKLEGVTKVEAFHNKNKVILEYHPKEVKEEAIEKEIETLGYSWKKGFFQRWMARMEKSNREQFGSGKMDCCHLTKK